MVRVSYDLQPGTDRLTGSSGLQTALTFGLDVVNHAIDALYRSILLLTLHRLSCFRLSLRLDRPHVWAQDARTAWRGGRKEESVKIKQDTHRRVDPPDRALAMRDTCVVHGGNERGDDGR